MTLSANVMTVLLVAALGTFAALIVPRLRLLLRAQPDDRFGQWGARLGSALKFAIGQWRMPREPVAGLAHIFIFAGFIIVAFATVQHFVHAYAPSFGLPGRVGQIYSLVKDVAELLVVLATVWAMWRRLRPKPTRVGRSWEGVFVLCMILALMLTDFLITGGELAANPERAMPYAPGGYLGALGG